MTDQTRPGRSRRRFTVDALFSDTRAEARGVADLEDAKVIQLDRITPDPDQPRRSFDQDRLDELAASIRAEGVLQPIVVRYDEPRDRYVIVHGERRFRATKQAGLAEIPALVREVPEDHRLLQQLMENIVREDLNAIDRAAALRALRNQLGDASWDVVAENVGIRKSRLFQLLGTEKLAPDAQEDIRSGRLSEKQSRALQGLSPRRQAAFRQLLLDRKMSESVAMRLSQAFRHAPIADEHDPESVRSALVQLADFLDPGTAQARNHQTRTLLKAVRARNADHYARLLAVPRFRNDRASKNVSAVARDLTRLDGATLEKHPDTRDALTALRDALTAVLDAAPASGGPKHKRTP